MHIKLKPVAHLQRVFRSLVFEKQEGLEPFGDGIWEREAPPNQEKIPPIPQGKGRQRGGWGRNKPSRGCLNEPKTVTETLTGCI